MTRTRRPPVPVLAVAFLTLVAACGDDADPTAPTDDDDDPEPVLAAVAGSVESTVAPGNAGAAPAARQSASAAATAEVATVAADGSLDVLASADVSGAEYVVTGIDGGHDRLVVVLRDSNGARVGGAMVHGTTVVDDTLQVAPVNGETTVEMRLVETLAASGEAAADARPFLAVMVSMDDDEAAGLLSDDMHVEAAASALARLHAGILATDEVLGVHDDLDAASFAALGASSLQTYVAARASGADRRDAHNALEEGFRATARDAGVTTEFWAVGGSVALEDYDIVNFAVRHPIGRQIVEMSLRWRVHLAGLQAGDVAADVEGHLAEGRLWADTASTGASVTIARDVARVRASESLVAWALEQVEALPQGVRGTVEGDMRAALEAAHTGEHLDPDGSDPEAQAALIEGYRNDVLLDVVGIRQLASVEWGLRQDSQLWLHMAAALEPMGAFVPGDL